MGGRRRGRWGWPLGAVALVLILSEAGLRFGLGLGDPPIARLDPSIEYVLLPGSYTRYGNRVDINTDGLRAPDITDTPPPGPQRIVLIGDSVIYGNHFLDQSETVAAVMSRNLQQAARPECRSQVIPVALSSWGPVNQAAYLARHGTFGAGQAIIVLSAHDLFDVPTHSRNLTPYRLAPSRTAIGDAWQSLSERLFPAPTEPVASTPRDVRSARSLAALDQMVSQFRATGARVSLVYHPTLRERSGRAQGTASVFRQWADRSGVPFVDLTSALPDPGRYRDDIHPASQGAERLAGALAEIAIRACRPD